MKTETKAKYLVVDTTGFIKNLQLQELAENVISLEEVVNEIKCHRQLKRLAVLPYDLTIKPVFPENVKIVTEFSKKTGDFPCLSAVDVKVMALTYQLEKELVGTAHLHSSPEIQKTIESYNPADVSFDNVAGFYCKDKIADKFNDLSVMDEKDLLIQNLKDLEVSRKSIESETIEEIASSDINEGCINEKINGDLTEKSASTVSGLRNKEKMANIEHKGDNSTEHSEAHNSEQDVTLGNGKGDIKKEIETEETTNTDFDDKDDLTPSPPDDQIELGYSSDDEGDDTLSDDNILDDDEDPALDFDHLNDVMILKQIELNTNYYDDPSDDDSIYDDDECGWITPNNISKAKRESASGVLSDEPVKVACLTTDFAMQNVLLQMGLNVMAVDGRIIKQVRTYILRCHACGKTTSIMTKIFCPKCGLKTLKRVAVSVDPDGKQQIFINYKRQITAKGKRWSIPKPQGGKHANIPILVEDQRMPQQRLSKKAMQRTKALEPDYIAGFSPFVMRDTTSKSVMLGFHTSRQNVKQLIGRNPNNKRTGKRKK